MTPLVDHTKPLGALMASTALAALMLDASSKFSMFDLVASRDGARAFAKWIRPLYDRHGSAVPQDELDKSINKASNELGAFALTFALLGVPRWIADRYLKLSHDEASRLVGVAEGLQNAN